MCVWKGGGCRENNVELNRYEIDIPVLMERNGAREREEREREGRERERG